ncbi:Rv3212 family protein [Actinophytocola sp.]|uniref:Rv3212 family protein n=1 Tax=Actinophytocola sp. TaxID=1872138 RepID=UPI003D6A7174
MTHHIGDEDVLDGRADPVREPVERSRFTRRRDVAAAALIAVVALVVGLLVWRWGDIRTTSSTTYGGPAPSPAQPTAFPPSLGEAWRATSGATPEPVTVGPAVVTGDGGEVAGRDPVSGEVRWRYSRDLPLCTLTAAWSMAVAVYEKSANLLPADDPRADGGCSETTALDPATGKRGKQPGPGEERDKPDSGQRNSDAERGTRLLYDGTYVTTTGERLLTTWRSDLVQTMEYGQVPAMVNPDKQPRTGCGYRTVTVVQARIGVVEDCPDDEGDRLTVYQATGNNDSEKPEVVATVEVAEGARVVAMTDQCRLDPADQEATQLCTAVVEPDPARLLVLNEKGEQVAAHPLSLGSGDLAEQPADRVVPTTPTPAAIYWFTGSRTIALSTADLSPLWTVDDTVGPGTMFAGQMLVPVSDGLRVLKPATGRPVGTLPVDRGGYTGLVTMSTLGPMVYEQRGDTLVAMR